MAAPFGGHPRLIDYLGWCSGQGCTTTSGFKVKDGVTVTFHIVAAASGEYVAISCLLSFGTTGHSGPGLWYSRIRGIVTNSGSGFGIAAL